MIVMKGVTAAGPLGGYPTTGFTVTFGEVEEIHLSSGAMVMAQVVSSSEVYAIASGVTGNIVHIRLYGPIGSSGINLDAAWASASTPMSTVEVALLADGY